MIAVAGPLPTVGEMHAFTDEGVARSYNAAHERWVERAEYWIRLFIEGGEQFSANDIWACGLDNPGNRRALGGVLRDFEAQGLIRLTGEREQSRWGHGQQIAIWIAT